MRSDGLHDVLHDVFTDLESHLGPYPRREAVMETGPDTSVGNFFGIGPHVSKSVRHAGRCRARHRDFGDVPASELRLDDTRDSAALDAMRAGIFGVHRRVGDWLPSCLAVRSRVAVSVAVADC